MLASVIFSVIFPHTLGILFRSECQAPIAATREADHEPHVSMRALQAEFDKIGEHCLVLQVKSAGLFSM